MRKITFIIVFLFPAVALANVVWPALLLEERLLSWWAISLGLVAEYLFVRKLLCPNILRASIATFCANFVSAVVGIILIPLLGLGWELTLGQLVSHVLDTGTFNSVSWGATFILACAANVSLEGLVYKFAFETGFRYKSIQFFWFMLANMVSVGVALYSLRVVPV